MRKIAQGLPVLGCLLVLTGVVVWLKSDGAGGPIGAGTGVVTQDDGAAPPPALGQGEPGIYLDLDCLRKEAELAIHGTVRSVRLVSIEGSPFNEAMVSVQRVLQPAETTLQEVTLLVYGAELNGIATETEGTPELVAGQEVVLFLKRWSYGHVIVGIQQGLFKIVEEDGRKTGIRDYTWLSIIGDSPALQDGFERISLSEVLGEPAAAEPAPSSAATVAPADSSPIPPTASRPASATSVVLQPARQRTPAKGPAPGEDSARWAIVLVALGGAMVLGPRFFSRRGAGRAGYTRTRLLVLVVAAGAVLMALPSRGRAYVTQTMSSSSATELKWMFNDNTPLQVVTGTKSVKYAIHTNGTADISLDGEKTLIAAQATLWNTVNFHWLRTADDTRALTAIKSYDNMNTVYWLQTSLADPHGKDMTGIPAWTFVQRNATTGELLDTDICINDKQFTWYKDGVIPIDPANPHKNQDLGTAVTHEFGHASGLSHSPHQAATMNAVGAVFDRYTGRSLERDDILGILRKYPPATYSTYTGRIAGTLKDNANPVRNIHSGIVLARNSTTGVVVAAVLSNKGNYQIDGLEAGSYVLQTQCAGRSMNDAPGSFSAYWSTSPTLSWRSNSNQDTTVQVTAGSTKTANLTVTYGSLAMKIDSLVTFLPLQLAWGTGNAPLRVPRGALAFPVGLKGQNLPAPSGATVLFHTSDIVVALGPHSDPFAPAGTLLVNINVAWNATLGPRNIELRKSDGTRVIAIGALEIY